MAADRPLIEVLTETLRAPGFLTWAQAQDHAALVLDVIATQAPAVQDGLSGFGWSAVLWSKARGSAMFASRPCDSESNAEGCAALWRKAYDPALFDVTVSPVFIKLPATSDVPVHSTGGEA